MITFVIFFVELILMHLVLTDVITLPWLCLAYLSYQNLINEHCDSFLNVKFSQLNCIHHTVNR